MLLCVTPASGGGILAGRTELCPGHRGHGPECQGCPGLSAAAGGHQERPGGIRQTLGETSADSSPPGEQAEPRKVGGSQAHPGKSREGHSGRGAQAWFSCEEGLQPACPSCHSPEVLARMRAVREAHSGLLQRVVGRGQRLQEQLQLHQLEREALLLGTWLASKVATAESQDYGQDLESITVSQS